MHFDIDVSGEDIFKKDFTICVADRNDIILGFKFTRMLLDDLIHNFRNNKYKYLSKSKAGISIFKIRLYSIAIYYIFQKLIKIFRGIKEEELIIQFCKDFYHHENDIKSNLSYFLKELLGLNITRFLSESVPKGANADHYAYLISKDTKNKFKGMIKISLQEFEEFLR